MVRGGDPALNVSSNGRRATMLFPVSGKIIRLNPALERESSLINEDCYHRGWVYTMQAENPYDQTRKLIGPDDASEWMQTESDRVFRVLTQYGNIALSDGGELLPDFSRNLREEDWNRLASMFFSGASQSWTEQ